MLWWAMFVVVWALEMDTQPHGYCWQRAKTYIVQNGLAWPGIDSKYMHG